MIDRVLGDRYQVKQQLGKKTGRQTLLAIDRQTQESVVVKLLFFSSDLEWDNFRLFEREAKTLKSLSHPAIPQYLDYFELNSPASKGFALVESYIPAKSLVEHLKSGRTFTEGEVKEIAKAILEILCYLHKRQPPVIHRDLKPSNILLSNPTDNSIGEIYLVDFGAVQTLAARESETITVVGTYGYMPPEQFGDRSVPASDLYSLGATLIYLVTGTHPADLPQKDLRIEFARFTDISPAFSHWLKSMTEPSLDRRLASAEKALQALENSSFEEAASLVVNKPFNSKVSLNKQTNNLEISAPSPGFRPEVLFLSLLAIAWNSAVLGWTFSTIFADAPFLSVKIFFTLFSLPFWGIGIGMILEIIFNLFGKVRLQLAQEQISLIYQLFGLKFNFRPGISILTGFKYGFLPAEIQEIDKLEIVYSLDGNYGTIAIWAGVRSYQLSHLSVPEIDWLANELSEWLRLPIQVRELPDD